MRLVVVYIAVVANSSGGQRSLRIDDEEPTTVLGGGGLQLGPLHPRVALRWTSSRREVLGSFSTARGSTWRGRLVQRCPGATNRAAMPAAALGTGGGELLR
jgi:hypothetical protein